MSRLRKLQQKIPNKLEPMTTKLRNMNLTKGRIIFFGGLAALVGSIFFIFVMTFLFVWYGRDLPQPGQLTARDIALSTKIFDRNNKLLYQVYGDKDRTYVTLDKIPKSLRDATVSIEDKNFYTHGGFDPLGYLRILKNVVVNSRLIGGSSITQQLVKIVFFSSERTISRKIKEFIVSVRVEKQYSKDQILEMYLNEAPYGGTIWGVESAAQQYFGKSVAKLNLVESAILAGLPQSPSYYSPFGSYPEAYKERTLAVLRRLREDKKITSQEYLGAMKDLEKIKFAAFSPKFKAPHFVMYVKSQLEEKFGPELVESGGLQVYTSLDLDLQNDLQQIMKDEVAKQKDLKVGNGSAVVLDVKSREILAMIGSKDYFAKDYDGNVNVNLSLRQPGSAIKPLTYALLLSKGYTASSVLMDVKTNFPVEGQKDYVPQNYFGNFRGIMQIRFALGNSQNIPAVKALAIVGLKNFLTTLNSLGMTNLAPTQENMSRYGLALTLGGGEVKPIDLTNAFATLGNKGRYKETVAIKKVIDAKGRLIFQDNQGNGKQIFSEDVSFIISHILSDNNARKDVFGAYSYLVIPNHTVAVKTGTTDNKKDNWTEGYTPSVALGVWVGNNNGDPMSPYVESGASGASIIWNKMMNRILKNVKNEDFAIPTNVVAKEVDALTGGLPHNNDPKRTEYFIKGTEPTAEKSLYRKIKVSKNNQKIANDTEIARGEYEEKEFIVLREQDPVSKDGKNRWQEAIDEWLKTQTDSKFHPPTELSDFKKDELTVRILKPSDHAKVDSNDVEISAETFSSGEIKELTVFVNGEQKNKYVNQKTFSEKYHLGDGTYEIKVKAKNDAGKEGEVSIKIGVNRDWDYVEPTATPSPAPTSVPTSTPTSIPPTPIPSVTITPSLSPTPG